MITLGLNQSGSQQMRRDKGRSESPFVHLNTGWSDQALRYPHFNITYEGHEQKTSTLRGFLENTSEEQKKEVSLACVEIENR